MATTGTGLEQKDKWISWVMDFFLSFKHPSQKSILIVTRFSVLNSLGITNSFFPYPYKKKKPGRYSCCCVASHASCCSCSLLLFGIHTHICICKRHYCFAVNTAHSSPQRIQMSSFRTLHLSLGFSAPRCMHWRFLLLHRNPDAHGRNCILWWGRWLGGKGISPPKSKFQFHSPDSIRSPWIGLCQEHFSHTASSASIIHVLFYCTWYVQVFAGFWELRERRILYFFSSWNGGGGERETRPSAHFFLAKEGAKRGQTPLVGEEMRSKSPSPWSLVEFPVSAVIRNHPVSAAASSVRSGEGFMCLSPSPHQPNLCGVITPQTCPSELLFRVRASLQLWWPGDTRGTTGKER